MKHPSAFFCTKCYQNSFFPIHIDDLTDVEAYISNQYGMIRNKPKNDYRENDNDLLTFNSANQDKIDKIKEKYEFNFEGDKMDIDLFLKENVTICEDCGMGDPALLGVDIDRVNFTYRDMYLELYWNYKFPLRSLFENQCIGRCPNGTTDIAGFCQPCDAVNAHCQYCRNSVQKCTKCW